ncbi:peptidase family C78-domain-containing protein [Phascolomyces articulosus]|uniref:Peptidase family C78-domain-containing protein n=1 Tax=Phascolomyces articulosus TaxID=60185 RepID=A0AAD5JTS3_9FUNG|nr:peptidase family C78-domain-containing protein [Phascolomyces articulosus]
MRSTKDYYKNNGNYNGYNQGFNNNQGYNQQSYSQDYNNPPQGNDFAGRFTHPPQSANYYGGGGGYQQAWQDFVVVVQPKIVRKCIHKYDDNNNNSSQYSGFSGSFFSLLHTVLFYEFDCEWINPHLSNVNLNTANKWRKRKDLKDASDMQESTRTKSSKTHDINNYTRTYLNTDEILWELPMPNSDRTTGLLTQLACELRKLVFQPKQQRTMVYLASANTDLIMSDFWDKGWSCGYRNCQILMSFLEKTKEMNDSIIKHVLSISGLQLLLERAWQEGFDQVGALQLKHRVYKTRKWIGTTEVYTLLAYLGVKCTIFEFDSRKNTSPNNNRLAECLFDCVQSYFEEAVVNPRLASSSSETKTKKKQESAFDRMMRASAQTGKRIHETVSAPMYLQHAGHSRTIVGIELLADGKRNLIVFDPGKRALCNKLKEDVGNANLNNNNNNNNSASQPGAISSLQTYWVDTKTIEQNTQYQLLVLGEVSQNSSSSRRIHWPSISLSRFLLTEWERDRMKHVNSIRII